MENWMYYLAGVATYLVYQAGYWHGKRRGLILGEKVGFGKRRRLDLAERDDATSRI